MLLMSSSDFFSKLTSSKSYFRNTIKVLNDAAIKERIKMTCSFVPQQSTCRFSLRFTLNHAYLSCKFAFRVRFKHVVRALSFKCV